MTSAQDTIHEGRSRLFPERRAFSRAAAPRDVTGWATTAFIAAVILVFASWGTLRRLHDVCLALGIGEQIAMPIAIALGIAVLAILVPAARSVARARAARQCVADADFVNARILTSAASDYSYYTFGFAALLAALIGFAQFLVANDLAVSRTFLLIPLMWQSFPLIFKAFWLNVYIFVVAEILVLVWGLIVAIARLIPGDTARPIRAMATLYTDVFRGMPAIITMYLVGFGLPLSGVPMLGNLSAETYAIIALTLTFGAYVAEVYKAGIESIHWSQVAAARSLGLSYLQTMRYIIVPQAIRRIIPPLLNDFIGLQKDTALVNVIGAIDAFNQAKIISSNNFNLSSVTVVAFIFIVITIPQARLVDRMLEKDQRRLRGG